MDGFVFITSSSSEAWTAWTDLIGACMDWWTSYITHCSYFQYGFPAISMRKSTLLTKSSSVFNQTPLTKSWSVFNQAKPSESKFIPAESCSNNIRVEMDKLAVEGNTQLLLQLLQKDPPLLDTLSYASLRRTPLHIAAIKGHLDFVAEILKRNPRLAEEFDSHQSSPLHLASAGGYLEIVKLLLSAAPEMCLSRDSQGRNPVHVAAVKGQAGVLAELVDKCPLAAREKTDGGFSAMHLCVRYGHLEALKVSMEKTRDLLDWKDDRDDTVLHVAVMAKNIEIIQYLVIDTNIDTNVKNSSGQTALAMLEQSPQDMKTSEIIHILKAKLHASNLAHNRPIKWLTKKRDSIMVVAILIATMAFQAGVSPPGGVWQEDSHPGQNDSGHRAGEAVMAHNHPKSFKAFLRVNTVAFVASLSTILLLISGLPFRRRMFMWMLMVIMWLTVTSTAATYAISIAVVTPGKLKTSMIHVTEISLTMWCSVMGVLLVGNTVRLVDRWLKNKGIVVWRRRRFRILSGECHV